MSKEYKLDQLKKDKVYNETLLSLWSGGATYQDLLATAMLTMGYELRQHNDCFMDLGQNEKESNKVIQLHGKNQSLVLWFTEGYEGAEYLIPILVTKEGTTLDFSLYNHENKKLTEYLEELTTKELYNAGDSVFGKLVELVTSERSPLEEKIGLPDYTLNSSDFLRILGILKNDPENTTTEIELALVDIYELLKGEGNKEIYIPVNVEEGGPKLEPSLSKLTSFVTKPESFRYKEQVNWFVNLYNKLYSDGTRIILSRDLNDIEVYDDKGLCYPVPIQKEDSNYNFSNTLGFIVPLAEHANELYSRLGDLEGVKFIDAEVLPDKVKLPFEKTTDWRFNKKITGALYFDLSLSLHGFTFQTELKGGSVTLQLKDGEVLTLPYQPMKFSKTIDSYETEVAGNFNRGMKYMEIVTLEDLLRDNNLLESTDKRWMD